jgi:hypothetical protein
VNEKPPRLSDAGAFDKLLRATMAKEPEDRWPMELVRDRLAEIGRDPAAADVTSTTVVEGDAAPATEVFAPISAIPPESAERGRRPRWPWLAAVGAAVLAVILVLALTDDDPREQPESEGPTSQPTSEPASEPTSDPPSTEATNTRRDVTEFITSYLSTVTTDRRATYALLTPEFQAESGGFQGYSQFWRNIASAEATNIEVDPEALTVSYDVSYRTVSGDQTSDSVSLQLERADAGYLIAGES